MKFATNIPLPVDPEEKKAEKAAALSQRSMSPTGSVDGTVPMDEREFDLANGKIDAADISMRDKKALTGFLYRSDMEFREKMHEIVKDFPTMKKEVGGKNFDEAISAQLFD